MMIEAMIVHVRADRLAAQRLAADRIPVEPNLLAGVEALATGLAQGPGEAAGTARARSWSSRQSAADHRT